MRKPGGVLLASLVAAVACGPDPAPPAMAASQPPAVVQPAPPAATAFDGARAWTHLERIVALGPRPSGSPELAATRTYITDQLAAAGIPVAEQRFTATTPNGRVEMVNLTARLPGRRTDRILITGHYDTKLMKEARFVGASDGGSSAALLIELARVLKDSPREFTLEFVWFDGEEATCRDWSECGSPTSPDNTYGSRHYVQTARSAGTLAAVKTMILVDMVGDRDLQIRRDSNSAAWLNDLVWGAAKRLAYGHVFLDSQTAIEDDHIPFVRAGVPAIDIIDLDYPYWHTPDDTLDKVSQRSLQIVGDVLVTALPEIEARLSR